MQRQQFHGARTQLIGRVRELERSAGLLRRSHNGQIQGLLLAGEPGAGKASLLDTAASLAIQAGSYVLRDGSSETEGKLKGDAVRTLQV